MVRGLPESEGRGEGGPGVCGPGEACGEGGEPEGALGVRTVILSPLGDIVGPVEWLRKNVAVLVAFGAFVAFAMTVLATKGDIATMTAPLATKANVAALPTMSFTHTGR